MKAEGNTLAKLDGPKSCQDLVDFAKSLENCSIVPYAGFHVSVNLQHSRACAKLDETGLNLLTTKVPARILRITVLGRDKTECEEVSGPTCKAIAGMDQLILS